jgi:predicted amidophosphoribosyltransferase
MGFLDNLVGDIKDGLANKARDRVTGGISNAVDKKLDGDGVRRKSCPKCRKTIPDEGEKFCPECGAALVASCKDCGTDYPLGTKFCTQCGKALKK